MKDLLKSVDQVKGIGPKTKERLEKLNIYNLLDLFYNIPRQYEDRSKFIKLSQARLNENSSFMVRVLRPARIRRIRPNFYLVEILVEDESGQANLIFFNQAYLKHSFLPGRKYKIFGKLEKKSSKYEIINPIYEGEKENEKVGLIVPIYDLTEGISNNQMIKFMEEAYKEYGKQVEDFIPRDILNKYNLLDLKDAIFSLHFPKDIDSIVEAKKRLAFEELLVLQMALSKLKWDRSKSNYAIKFDTSKCIDHFITKLPFKLTNAQNKVLKEIRSDMTSDIQMNRLIQGDVGSGKTIVAAISMLKAVESGFQASFMAPTEILARQHYSSLKEVFREENINIALLTGSIKKRERDELLCDLSKGKIDILIGTHALLEDRVKFKNLGLVITDEQHRFGVKQRGILNNKGQYPDIMVMTATPIPRTLAYILYGDLDISIIDELPPARKKIASYAVDPSYIHRINKFINKQVESGRQVYVVCPLVEKSEQIKAYSAQEVYKDYKKIFSNHKVGLLHGQLSSLEKDQIMGSFKDGEIDILVSTTVIEVGVDVPNANLILVYNAERFGLAQLHQLRGRVGRGQHESYCILLNTSMDDLALERMKIMEDTNDGFIISEKDLELRGPGQFFGTRQHGLPELKIANLFRDIELVKVVKEESTYIMKNGLLEREDYSQLSDRVNQLINNLDNNLVIG